MKKKRYSKPEFAVYARTRYYRALYRKGDGDTEPMVYTSNETYAPRTYAYTYGTRNHLSLLSLEVFDDWVDAMSLDVPGTILIGSSPKEKTDHEDKDEDT